MDSTTKTLKFKLLKLIYNVLTHIWSQSKNTTDNKTNREKTTSTNFARTRNLAERSRLPTQTEEEAFRNSTLRKKTRWKRNQGTPRLWQARIDDILVI